MKFFVICLVFVGAFACCSEAHAQTGQSTGRTTTASYGSLDSCELCIIARKICKFQDEQDAAGKGGRHQKKRHSKRHRRHHSSDSETQGSTERETSVEPEGEGSSTFSHGPDTLVKITQNDEGGSDTAVIVKGNVIQMTTVDEDGTPTRWHTENGTLIRTTEKDMTKITVKEREIQSHTDRTKDLALATSTSDVTPCDSMVTVYKTDSEETGDVVTFVRQDWLKNPTMPAKTEKVKGKKRPYYNYKQSIAYRVFSKNAHVSKVVFKLDRIEVTGCIDRCTVQDQIMEGMIPNFTHG